MVIVLDESLVLTALAVASLPLVLALWTAGARWIHDAVDAEDILGDRIASAFLGFLAIPFTAGYYATKPLHKPLDWVLRRMIP